MCPLSSKIRQKNEEVFLFLFLIIVPLVLDCMFWHRVVPFSHVCPEIYSGEYSVTVIWDEIDSDVQVPEIFISDLDMAYLFSNVSLKCGFSTIRTPAIAFEVKLSHSPNGYSIVIGYDNSIIIGNISNLKSTRTYWVDTSKNIFLSMYSCHLKNGGQEISIIEEFLKNSTR